MAFVAASIIGGLGSLAGGLLGSGAAQNAAQEQYQAAMNAAKMQQGMYNQTQQNLLPYMQGGQTGMNMLTGEMPYLTQGFNPTMQELESMPGYQFQRQQG